MPYFQPYKYVKDASNDPFYSQVNKKFVWNTVAYPVILSSVGLFVFVTQVLWPLVVFTSKKEISKPAESTVLGVSTGFRDFEFGELTNTTGATTQKNVPEFYYLTIPKLGIEKAKVKTQPENLDPSDALHQYIGSSLPGQPGNAFVYGHSVLPVFFNSENYKTIFSTLPELKVGDRFTVEYNNKTYVYEVKEVEELKPEEVKPLSSFPPKNSNDSTMTLMTCSPPGTKLRRLLINAELVD